MRPRPIVLPMDRSAVLALADRMQGSGLRTLSESQVLALTAGTALGFVIEDDGIVSAYVGVIPTAAAGEWAMEVICDLRRGALPALVSLAMEAVSQRNATTLRWWVYGDEAAEVPLGYGFGIERCLLRMARPLPADASPRFEPDIELAPFRPGTDEEAWLAVNNAAFAGHPENGGWTIHDLAERMQTEWFSAAGFRMAWSGGNLAGFCWTKVHPPVDGEIYVIAVAPGQRGSGLGRQLVLEGMGHLSDLGCRRVHLYVDADNERGIALYRGLGFLTEKVHRSFISKVPFISNI